MCVDACPTAAISSD
ncbi:MAG: hypothetical protein K8R19_08250 [Methanosarcinales archaeon]|nr:hypothetical protein [Methanosarcinales archaeon]